ncbi:hypothetical protein SDC9_155438 [bioreactor metagenome]|uniref:Uncharacterized protein n=1 Tax=bioreactor metagenome TaxID=1076179 RepID=A0A645F1H0_9ZZZZ
MNDGHFIQAAQRGFIQVLIRPVGRLFCVQAAQINRGCHLSKVQINLAAGRLGFFLHFFRDLQVPDIGFHFHDAGLNHQIAFLIGQTQDRYDLTKSPVHKFSAWLQLFFYVGADFSRRLFPGLIGFNQFQGIPEPLPVLFQFLPDISGHALGFQFANAL